MTKEKHAVGLVWDGKEGVFKRYILNKSLKQDVEDEIQYIIEFSPMTYLGTR